MNGRRGQLIYSRDAMIRDMGPADVAHAALCEASRPDLAQIAVWFEDDDEPGGGYIETMDEIVGAADYDLVDRAEQMARTFNARRLGTIGPAEIVPIREITHG